jgi:hypothetical protein
LAGVTEPQPTTEQGRPLDVDTGFWLWVAALPLMVIGYVVDLMMTENRPPTIVYAVSIVFVIVVAAIVATFLILMRHGYRWARTLLTGGGVASVVYAATNLFAVRPTAAAVVYAVAVIVGSVLIVGGVVLLHRKDAHGFFTR